MREIKTRGAPERNESIDDQQVISHVLALISPKIRLQNTAKNVGRKFQKVAQNYRIKKKKNSLDITELTQIQSNDNRR